MTLWTQSEFDRYAFGTKLSDRSLAACKEVLVDGVAGVEAAARHKIFPAQVSRSIALLRNKQAEMLLSAESLKDENALLKYTAAQVAKTMVGASLKIEDAEPGKTYEGPMIVSTHGFVVQKTGRGAAIHDLGNLPRLPEPNVPVSITYPRNGEKATVTDLAQQKQKDVGR